MLTFAGAPGLYFMRRPLSCIARVGPGRAQWFDHIPGIPFGGNRHAIQ